MFPPELAEQTDTAPWVSKASPYPGDRSMITGVMDDDISKIMPVRHLIVVLGDQLDRDSAAFDGIDLRRDVVWMCEAREESTRVPVSRPRIAMFLAAMRHFRDELQAEGLRLIYRSLDARCPSLAAALRVDIERLAPARVVVVEPGEWHLREAIRELGSTVELRADRHFLCSHETFARHAKGRKQLRMEFFYREMRRAHGVLLDAAGEPEGGEWNYDALNRKSFGRDGPSKLTMPAPRAFRPDALTRQVIAEVNAEFADHPGALADFDWPVTRKQALAALTDFIEHRLAAFGDHQDAMWSGEPWLFHSRIAAAMNLKLLRPSRSSGPPSASTVPDEHRWPRLRDSFAKFLVGANTCAACIGCTCRAIWNATHSAPANPCRHFSGPARHRCAALPTAWVKPCATVTPITFKD